MSICEFIGVLTLAIVIFTCMLDTDWKRKVLRHKGKKTPYLLSER